MTTVTTGQLFTLTGTVSDSKYTITSSNWTFTLGGGHFLGQVGAGTGPFEFDQAGDYSLSWDVRGTEYGVVGVVYQQNGGYWGVVGEQWVNDGWGGYYEDVYGWVPTYGYVQQYGTTSYDSTGTEMIHVDAAPISTVPETGSTLSLLGTALVAIAGLRRKFARA